MSGRALVPMASTTPAVRLHPVGSAMAEIHGGPLCVSLRGPAAVAFQLLIRAMSFIADVISADRVVLDPSRIAAQIPYIQSTFVQ